MKTPLLSDARGRTLLQRIAAGALGAAWAVAAVLVVMPAHADEPIPARAFFARNDISAVALSPSGKFLALTVANKSGRTVLAVAEVESTKAPVVVAAAAVADIRSFRWVGDDWLVYNVIDLQAPGRDQGFGPGLFSVRRDGSQTRQLIRERFDTFSTGTSIASNQLEIDHALLFVPRNGGTEVIVGQYRFDGAGDLVSIVPKRLDVATGRSRRAALGIPANSVEWVFDPAGEPRVAQTSSGGMTEVFWRDMGNDTWQSLMKTSALDAPWAPVDIDDAGHFYVSAASPSSTSVLKRFDFATRLPEPEAIVSTPGFDFSGSLVFNAGRVLGVRIDTDAETTVWFDPERKKLQALADARFPDRINRISCGGCAPDGAMLVRSYSDRDPGIFSVYRPATQTWTTVGRVRSAIDPRQMGTLDLHRIKARDGLDLPVWVTQPRGKASAPRPAVVLVHGGPWVRGTEWRWNADAQFLAARGYVVIEPEYRGSTGFGERHFRAGWKNWGTSMQDDVADAVRWAADKGLVDSKRVCIAGASYGGYATLMGAIRYPDLYRCGVAWVAVADPRLLYQDSWASDISRDARRFSLPTMLGDPVKDAAMLKEAAPVERAAEIKVPILMAFGREDVRVPIEHGTRMRSAMRAVGREPEYIVYEGEGHGWLKVENELDFWGRVEKFLAKSLGN